MKLEDIARKAGVSRSTVSRVVNNDAHVSERTRTKVTAVIEAEGFTPDPVARMLVTGRSGIIGVVVPQTTKVFLVDNSYFPQLLQGASEAINERDLGMLLWLQHSHENREHFANRIAKNRLMDGLILCSMMLTDVVILRMVETGHLFVMVERPPDSLVNHVSYVTVDNVYAAQNATEHLIHLGRRRIAHITGQLTIADGIDRLKGYKVALECAGMPVDPQLIVEGNFQYEDGYQCMKKLLLLPRRKQPDAIFCGGDTSAQGAMQAIREAGLRVPDDIAIVGFDDLDVAINSAPQLTTVHQPVQEKGITAANLLMDLIDGKLEGPQQVILPTSLVIRDSCGAKLSSA